MPCSQNSESGCFSWEPCTSADNNNNNNNNPNTAVVTCYSLEPCQQQLSAAQGDNNTTTTACVKEKACQFTCSSSFRVALKETNEGFVLRQVEGSGIRLVDCASDVSTAFSAAAAGGCVVFKACDVESYGSCYAKYPCTYDPSQPYVKCYTALPCQ